MSPIVPLAHVTSNEDPDIGINDLSKRDQYPSSSSPSSYAPWYNIPHKHIVSVEHPFIIKNTEKGVGSLGGPSRLQELMQDGDDVTARLYLRPGERMSKPLVSANVSTRNVLLKITVPKRTGLKRRKGSQGPFYEGLENFIDLEPEKKRGKQGSLPKDTRCLIRTMRDSSTTYEIQVTGTIERTHRFRGMPDFVISTANMPFMKKMQEHILPFDYEKMKAFAFDMSKGPKPNTEIIPPPVMTRFTHPFNYSYRQNPLVKQVTDPGGNISLVNTNGQPKIKAQSLPYNAPKVPNAPSSQLDPVESLEPALQHLIASALRLLEERPIFTRRALINCLPGKDWETTGSNSARHIFQYCGYSFSGGPWRDAIIRFGVDPRKDASCRAYQTMMFMLDSQPKDKAKWTHSMPDRRKTEQVSRKESHLFDGATVSKDGKIWQACDITDPFLKDLLATTDLRKECHIETDGWYHNGTWSKVRMIMKAKITAILTGTPQQHAAYAKVARELPDDIKPGDKVSKRLGKDATQHEIQLASAIRSSCFTHRVPVMESTPSQEGESEDDGEDGEIAMPDRFRDEIMDPRVTGAVVEINRLERGTAQIEGMVDGMDTDNAQESSIQEALDHQLRQGY